MGAAGAKGFRSSLSGSHLKDVRENEAIRGKDDDTGHNDIYPAYNNNLNLIGISVGTGELQQREKITEIVVDGVFVTESQSKHPSSMYHGTRKSHYV